MAKKFQLNHKITNYTEEYDFVELGKGGEPWVPESISEIEYEETTNTSDPSESFRQLDISLGDRFNIYIRQEAEGKYDFGVYQPGAGGPPEVKRKDLVKILNKIDPEVRRKVEEALTPRSRELWDLISLVETETPATTTSITKTAKITSNQKQKTLPRSCRS